MIQKILDAKMNELIKDFIQCKNERFGSNHY